jgi:hypothetical protein
MDASISGTAHWGDQKNFLKHLARGFPVSATGSRAAIISFASSTQHSIKFKDSADQTAFLTGVSGLTQLPDAGSAGNTRIDMALHLAQTDMFTAANGGRSDKPDLLIVILEGEQSVIAQNTGNNKQIGEQIRAKGIKMFVVGIGANVQASSLKDIAGGTYNYIHAADWNELTNEEFIGKCLDMACRALTDDTLVTLP